MRVGEYRGEKKGGGGGGGEGLIKELKTVQFI